MSTTISTTTIAEQPPWESIIQAQSDIAIIGIIAIIAISGLVAAWNIYFSRREIKAAVDSHNKRIRNELEKNFEKLTEDMKNEVEKIKTETEKSIDEKMIETDAEIARAYVHMNQQINDWEAAIGWLCVAIEKYAKCKKDYSLRTCVDALNSSLDKCEEIEDERIEGIKKCIPYIPNILSKEKKQIEDKLKKLQQKDLSQQKLDLE